MMRTLRGCPSPNTGVPGASTKTRSPSRWKKRPPARMKKLSPSPSCAASPAVSPPLEPNTALADRLEFVRSCHPPSRVRDTSPAPADGARRTTIAAARQARRETEGLVGVLMKKLSLLPVEAEAAERDRRADEAVPE